MVAASMGMIDRLCNIKQIDIVGSRLCSTRSFEIQYLAYNPEEHSRMAEDETGLVLSVQVVGHAGLTALGIFTAGAVWMAARSLL